MIEISVTLQKFSKTRKVLADHDYVVAQEAELEGTIRVFANRPKPGLPSCTVGSVRWPG